MILGVDIGGTFTDLVAFDARTRRSVVCKTLNQGHGPRRDLLATIKGANIAHEQVAQLTHGTTVVTNLLIERTGSRVGLITTRGFRDILEIQDSYRRRSFDFSYTKTPPLVGRELRLEVGGRIDASGRELEPLPAAEVEEAVHYLVSQGVAAIAIVLYNSYANPAHERAAAAIVRRIAPDLPVTASVDVDRRIGEFVRTSTTVLNAIAMTRMHSYIDDLARAIRPEIQYMHSAAGVLPATEAKVRPIQLAFSGPAAGVLAGCQVARQLGYRNAITMDMGGTSCDVSLMWEGNFNFRSQIEIEWGVPARIEALDVRSIGAGGGSICWIDNGGALRVGPRSAGAVPGPACYAQGGTEPTVTDANLVLGLLPLGGLLGGELRIDEHAAQQALTSLGRNFEIDARHAAAGVYAIVNANMAQAVREITVNRGLDPRECILVAFGGAGPQHAAAVAATLGIKVVVVPANGSVLSAIGLLTADVRVTSSRTLLVPLKSLGSSKVKDSFDELDAEALVRLGEPIGGQFVAERWLSLRYVGQSHEVAVRYSPDPDQVARSFEAEHERLYGTQLGDPIEVVDCWTTLVTPREFPPDVWLAGDNRTIVTHGRRCLHLAGSAVPVHARSELGDHAFNGPCLIDERHTVTFVPEGVRAQLEHGHLLLEVER